MFLRYSTSVLRFAMLIFSLRFSCLYCASSSIVSFLRECSTSVTLSKRVFAFSFIVAFIFAVWKSMALYTALCTCLHWQEFDVHVGISGDMSARTSA